MLTRLAKRRSEGNIATISEQPDVAKRLKEMEAEVANIKSALQTKSATCDGLLDKCEELHHANMVLHRQLDECRQSVVLTIETAAGICAIAQEELEESVQHALIEDEHTEGTVVDICFIGLPENTDLSICAQRSTSYALVKLNEVGSSQADGLPRARLYVFCCERRDAGSGCSVTVHFLRAFSAFLASRGGKMCVLATENDCAHAVGDTGPNPDDATQDYGKWFTRELEERGIVTIDEAERAAIVATSTAIRLKNKFLNPGTSGYNGSVPGTGCLIC